MLILFAGSPFLSVPIILAHLFHFYRMNTIITGAPRQVNPAPHLRYLLTSMGIALAIAVGLVTALAIAFALAFA